ncbi:TIGR00341 family protein [Candidatus Accumulibacter sp. ACC007]|uniref:TIGR00341 family protein n=1 Tax=Candidatus Accumulibacter sp. ACC007 TaxID=2823333 RepID=UPI0025C47220|nr:TIGR00341 family protein [Candidatus Accumulibacter sp. ACC007]
MPTPAPPPAAISTIPASTPAAAASETTAVAADAAEAASVGEDLLSTGSFFRALWLGPRAWGRWWRTLVREIDHRGILEQVEQDANFSFNFCFMIVVAGGIATIGLLLNSPAVIIGAMLISPLMGPIVGSGMAIATLDFELARKSLRTLALGTAAAVAFTSLIVLLSPVKELTPELLARTRPNLFDLVVAILSGAAGGYALIRGRGGAIVGVAIATALMPPLATIGYGLVTERWPVARGALLLFFTNMAAISLSVAAVAEWYGFGRGGLRKRFARQAAISLLVLVPLGVPLFISLKAIAFESFAQIRIRNILEAGAASLPAGQLGAVEVLFMDGKPPRVRAMVLSAEPDSELSARLDEEIERQLRQPVDLQLTQLRTSEKVSPQVLALGLPERPLSVGSSVGSSVADSLRSAFPLPLVAFEADPAQRSATLVPEAQAGIDLAAWRAMESDLEKRHPEWTIRLLPPPQALPPIYFEPGSKALDGAARARVETIVWAAQRWKIDRVEVVGHASSDRGGPPRLAGVRAERVAEALRAGGLAVGSVARFPLPNQLAAERELGEAAFRAVSVLLPVTTNKARKE